MSLVIEERDLGGHYVEAYFTADPQPAYMAIQHDVLPMTKRCRAIEGHGYYRRPPRSLRKVCYLPPSPYAIDEQAIEAMRPIIEEHITAAELNDVKYSYRASESGDAWWIAWDCELHPYVVIAILRNLLAQGELADLN